MRKFVFGIAMMLGFCGAVGCAERAPELPQGVTASDVTFADNGDMMVNNYCISCCPEWCPGPSQCCPPGPGDPPGPIYSCDPRWDDDC